MKSAPGPPASVATDSSASPPAPDVTSGPTGPVSKTRTGGDDAVCFTAGFAGAMFGAGAIHAYLAADRKPPAVVAGISMGALNAVAMQRCYQELEKVAGATPPEREVARWTWFREYVTSLTDEPLGAIWRGLPRKADLGADLPPIRDTALEEFTDERSKAFLKDEETRARRELYLFMRLGRWLAGLPLKFSDVANFLVTYVRVRENVPGKRWVSRLNLATYAPARLLVPVLWHICLKPTWFNESRFLTLKMRRARYYRPDYWIRPLFGWWIFLVAWATFIPMIVIACLLAAFIFIPVYPFLSSSRLGLLIKEFAAPAFRIGLLILALWVFRTALLVPASILCGLSTLFYLLWETLTRWFRAKGQPKRFRLGRSVFHGLSKQLFGRIELKQALIHNFHLRLRLTRLFGQGGRSDRLTEAPMPVVLVAAPLQAIQEVDDIRRGVSQVWARKNARLVDALLAALAVPGVYPPRRVIRSKRKGPPGELRYWEVDSSVDVLDLVDGSVVRENPLPALFRFIKMPGRQTIAQKLSSSPEDPRVHVVFSVPYGEPAKKREAGPLGLNIVDVLSISLRLNRRRDTRLEIGQVNFMSELEYFLRRLSPNQNIDRGQEERLYPIFADSVSPDWDVRFENPLQPDPDEVLGIIAAGCRRTLETIFIKEIRAESSNGEGPLDCHAFLSRRAPEREWRALPETEPGMPEVCSHCTRKLHSKIIESEPWLPPNLLRKYGKLTGERPRIVFLASGGVFRGSFHVGMLACLLAADIRPDIIVGASVGTLMGGALAAMFSVGRKPARDRRASLSILRDMVDVLLHVDKKIAFTKTLKTAVRELGIRARDIRFSPNDIRRMVRQGARSDPGFAATGAPPALIDALSNLLFLPHSQTSRIAAQFVAGNVTQATKRLLGQMKTTTLQRLDIEYALMGVSLLEPTAYRLLGEKYGIPLQSLQPFLRSDIAFFATTTNLLTEEPRPRLLGLDSLDETSSFDLVQATLASSAFPAIFAPRRESDVFPGVGRRDVLLSDGGMFDNLPFVPTIEFLAEVQRNYCQAAKKDPIAFLHQRHDGPDLFIAGSLNVPPEWDTENAGPYDDIVSTVQRAGTLQDNLKIRAFLESSALIANEVDLLVKHVPASQLTDGSRSRRVIDGIVETGVLPVFPADREHLNPTYAFSASVGMQGERVQRSIVNGCFQTFGALANAQNETPPYDLQLAHRSIKKLLQPWVDEKQERPPRVPVIRWAGESGGPVKKDGYCPYFRMSPLRDKTEDWQLGHVGDPPAEFRCPFYEASELVTDCSEQSKKETRELYDVCCGDRKHQEEAKSHSTRARSWQLRIMTWFRGAPLVKP